MTTATQPDLIATIAAGQRPTVDEVTQLLQLEGDALKDLYRAADAKRAEIFGDAVHIRGIIEFSNYCRKQCSYCGIHAGNSAIPRYRMSADEIVAVAAKASHSGATTVVLQSGEDLHFGVDDLAEIIHRVKSEAGVPAVTLSIGERSVNDYRALKQAGCDRYLLRFETSDRALYAGLHPDGDFDNRIACLRNLRSVGIQVGSGFMIGLPDAGLDVLAQDILFATDLELDMIGCGPFVAHPNTPLAGNEQLEDREIYFKTMAILRLLNPLAHIPSTTAFDAIFKFGRDRVLQRGANVFMPNLTPQKYRKLYQLYPNKPCVDESAEQCAACTVGRMIRLGRKLGTGPGHSIRTHSPNSNDEAGYEN